MAGHWSLVVLISLCPLVYVFSLLQIHCAFAIWFNGHLPSRICHAIKILQECKIDGWAVILVPRCLNILQMDNSHQQVTVHQSIGYHSDTKPTFSNSFSSQLSHTTELAQNSQLLLFKP
jgi:hypothetical protein